MIIPKIFNNIIRVMLKYRQKNNNTNKIYKTIIKQEKLKAVEFDNFIFNYLLIFLINVRDLIQNFYNLYNL